MDPKETLERLRKLTQNALEAHDTGDFDYLMTELASNFESLDAWMSNAGYNPWDVGGFEE